MMKLYGEKVSKCCKVPTILVQSREGGFVTQNCSNCGKSRSIRLEELPILYCGECKEQLEAFQNKNYFYRCVNCGFSWELPSIIPHWSKEFDQWIGYGLPSDPNFLSPDLRYRSDDHASQLG